MKRLTTLFTSLAILAVFILGCNTEQASKKEATPPTAQKQMSKMEGNPIIHQIDSANAESYIKNYRSYIEGVSKSLVGENEQAYLANREKLVYGAQVDRIELREMLIKSEPGDSVYAMLSTMPSGVTEIIFAVNSTTKGWTYFDFTRPCPNACPDWFSVE